MGNDNLPEKRPVGWMLIMLAAFVVVVAGLKAASSIITPFLLAAFLTVICFPPLAWLQRKRVPSWLALLIVLGVGILIVISLVAITGSSVTEFAQRLPSYQENLIKQQNLFTDWLEGIPWLKEHHVEVAKLPEQIGLNPKVLVRIASNAIGTIGSLSGNLILVLLIFVFLLIEASGLPVKFQAMPGYTHKDEDRLEQILGDIRNYLAIKTEVSLLTGFLVTVWLWILGVDFAILWGLLAFFCNFIPNIGSVIAAIPAVLLALVQLGPAASLYVILGYLGINAVIGNALEPRLMGRGLGLSTLVVFLSLIFWGWVLGPVGMLLSVPLTMMVKIALDRFDETRWIAILLAAHVEKN